MYLIKRALSKQFFDVLFKLLVGVATGISVGKMMDNNNNNKNQSGTQNKLPGSWKTVTKARQQN